MYRKGSDEVGVQMGEELNGYRNTKSQLAMNSALIQTIERVMMVLNDLGVVVLF